MCGIAGVAGPGRRDWLAEAVARQRHRGPDASGVREFGPAALGHTRLRILDLRPEADQPMSGEDARVWVVFNGEIYNHSELRSDLVRRGHMFLTHSDTEVLVHGYEEHGEGFIDQLRGMFALAVWDDRTGRLLLARDRFGIKPLYYCVEAGSLVFASEARVIGAGRPWDRAALAGYLRLGWVSGPRTIYAGVQELPPGHHLTWAAGRATMRRWSPPLGRPGGSGTLEGLSAALRDAMSRHLTADVPVGLFLSSGVDSTALASLAGQAGSRDVSCYTVGFPDGGLDETAPAAVVARELGFDHHVVDVGHQEVLAQLPTAVASLDQPSVDGVNTWVVSRAARQAGARVALSGLGGDEIFSGYSTWRHVPRLVLAGAPGAMVPDRARDWGCRWADRVVPAERGRRVAEAVLTGGWPAAYAAVRGVLGGAEVDSLLGASPSPSTGLAVSQDEDSSDADMVTRLEMANYLPNQLLRDTDATSMAHSLEVRVPLLDDRVVAEALTRPVEAGAPAGKARLAAAAGGAALEAARGPKRTFTLPFDAWLAGPLHQSAREASVRLCQPDVGLARAGMEGLWRRFEAGRLGWRAIWALAALGIWVDARPW